MSFFEMTPVGRILNRFGKDLDVIDTLIAVNFQAWITCMLRVLATPVIIAYSTPLFCVVIIPLGILYFAIQVSVVRVPKLKGIQWISFLVSYHLM